MAPSTDLATPAAPNTCSGTTQRIFWRPDELAASAAPNTKFARVAPKALEAAMLGNDMSRLTDAERVGLVQGLCEYVGIPFVPGAFVYIPRKGGGGLGLYASKLCAELIRGKHRIDIQVLDRAVENGVLTVRVKGTMPDGRSDESIGAVPISPKATADDAAMAYMKCETKAKRRVTFSLVGLGSIPSDDDREYVERRHAAATDGRPSQRAALEALNGPAESGALPDPQPSGEPGADVAPPVEPRAPGQESRFAPVGWVNECERIAQGRQWQPDEFDAALVSAMRKRGFELPEMVSPEFAAEFADRLRTGGMDKWLRDRRARAAEGAAPTSG